jgi:hypothetical protein
MLQMKTCAICTAYTRGDLAMRLGVLPVTAAGIVVCVRGVSQDTRSMHCSNDGDVNFDVFDALFKLRDHRPAHSPACWKLTEELV